MQRSIVRAALIAAAAIVLATPAMAADSKSKATAEPDQKATPTQRHAKPRTKAKSGAVSRNLVDINSASKAELKKLPQIGDAEADKIIAGRPYGSKADLVTHDVLSAGTYEAIRKQVMAKPK